jgi:hypothetical protein
LWGEHDVEPHGAPQTLRVLSGAEVNAARGVILPQAGEDADWSHGIHRREAALRISAADLGPHIEVGDQLVFSGSGTRRVTAVDGAVVHVEGAPLDPLRDGNPRVVRFAAPDAQPGTTSRPRHPRTYTFDPIRPGEGGSGTELRLRVRADEPVSARIVVAYGRGEKSFGRFLFTLRPDVEAHDYVLRMSSQANWSRIGCDWIRILPSQGAVEVEDARISVGD